LRQRFKRRSFGPRVWFLFQWSIAAGNGSGFCSDNGASFLFVGARSFALGLLLLGGIDFQAMPRLSAACLGAGPLSDSVRVFFRHSVQREKVRAVRPAIAGKTRGICAACLVPVLLSD
jgi:hypothetical protein